MRDRPALVLGLVAALVAVLAIVAAVVAGTREHPALDAGTPAGVVQLYVVALYDGDDATAVQYLDPALGCTDPLPERYLAGTARIGVAATTVTGDRATVDLRIEEGAGLDTWSHRETFTLRRDGETWLITGHPWPIYECERWVD